MGYSNNQLAHSNFEPASENFSNNHYARCDGKSNHYAQWNSAIL